MTTPLYNPRDAGWMDGWAICAALGQPDATPEKPAPKLYLRRVRLNRRGYDGFGCYWGYGAPLYQAADENGDILLSMRAQDRDDAKEQVRETYPDARFWR